MLHLLNFFLVYCFLRLLLEKVSERSKVFSPSGWKWVALAISVYWVLHPLHVSTVMYVVQRMTILSVTFTLLALIAYFSLRPASPSPGRRYIWIGSITILSIASAFCKEIGVLTFAYIALLEVVLFPASIPKTIALLRKKYFLTVPVVITTGYLAISYISRLPAKYEYREFDLIERASAQVYIIFEIYLRNIFFPSLDRMSLFHDGYPVRESLDYLFFVFVAVFAVSILLAYLVRKKHAPLSIGIGIFFISHSIESTILPLELVFEHRNYFSVLGITLSTVYLCKLALLRLISNRKLVFAISVIPALIFSQLTFVRSIEWSDIGIFSKTAYVNQPESIRATMEYISYVANTGDMERVNQLLDESMVEHPGHASFAVHKVHFSAKIGVADSNLISAAAEALATYPFREAENVAMLNLLSRVEVNGIEWPATEDIVRLFEVALSNPVRKLHLQSVSGLYAYYSDFLFSQGRYERAEVAIDKSIEIVPSSVEARLRLIRALLAMERFNDAKSEIDRIRSFKGSEKYLSDIEYFERLAVNTE